MSFIASGAVIGAAVTLGTTMYSADKNRKAQHQQQDALTAAREADARKTAEAETNAAVAANAQAIDSKRRKRDNALALGDPNGSNMPLGGTSVLGAGSTTQVATKSAGNVLGSAAR